MNTPRSTISDVRLSRRERRCLRRIDDCTFAEDPLLDMRLGLAGNRSKRVVVRLRRRAKAWTKSAVRRTPAAAVAAAWLALVLVSLLVFGSVVAAALLSVPIAFVLGLCVARTHPLGLATTKRNLVRNARSR